MLKRTGGLAVRALAQRMSMSYMGVKQYCLELERQGFLEVRRQPRGEGRIGRPELVYRLTPKAHSLFPTAANNLTLELLDAVQRVYGGSAPEKLLFAVFQRRSEVYAEMIAETGAVSYAERVRAFAKLRDEEGCMSSLEGLSPAPEPVVPPPEPAADEPSPDTMLLPFDAPAAASPVIELEAAGPVRLIEHRSPIADLAGRYPIVLRLEREMMERVLRSTVLRADESEDAEHYRVVFTISLK